MHDKYTKAASVTVNDSNDLSAVADALYIGAGDYTDAQDLAALAGDAGNPEFLVHAGASFTVSSRGSTTTYLNNIGSAGSSSLPDSTDPSFVAVLANAPTIDTDDATLNYKEMVSFNGGNYLKFEDDPDMDFGTGDFTIIFLARFVGTQSNNKETLLARDDDDSIWSIYKDTDNVIKVAHAGDDPTSGVTVTNDRWYTVEWSRSSGTETIYIDGVNQGSSASNSENYSSVPAVRMYLGARNDSGIGEFFAGKIAWFAMWNGSTLSAADRVAVNNYLNDRYLKTPQVDVAYISSDNASSVTSKRLERGTVHPLSVKRVMNTGTDGSSIIALYK